MWIFFTNFRNFLHELQEFSSVRFIKKIDKGGYGDVWKVNVIRSQIVDISVPNEMACKITSIRPLATHMDDALKESKILSQLNHTNIVRFFFIHRFAESNRRSFVCLFMELCDGELKAIIESSQRLTQNRARQ
jgi:serine/threonine protein kinase